MIFGRGGHGAHPHLTIDPVVIAAHLIVDLQSIIARELEPGDPAVITVGSLVAGTVGNVIPDTATLLGTVRTFRPGEDEAAWLEVNNRAFAGHPEQGDWTLATIEAREAEDWFHPAGFLLAFDADGLAGFCWTKVHLDTQPVLGEIYVIAVDPDFHGLGLGRAMTIAGLDHLARAGVGVGMLFVDADNAAALGLYRDLGFSIHRTDCAFVGDIAPVTS